MSRTIVRVLRLPLLVAILAVSVPAYAQAPSQQEKARVIVLTDIENEPDDAQSLVRFLTYANQFQIEGLIATTSVWMRDKTAAWRIREIVDAYGKVKDNLEEHEPGWPSHAYLSGVIKGGRPDYGMAGVGEGKDSEGSEWIINVVDKDDPRPVWILSWGGPNCLAQSLWKIKQTRSPEALRMFVSKLRVYAISDQDNSGPWMRKTFPELFYIASPGYQENGEWVYRHDTWTGISGDRVVGEFEGGDFAIVDLPWLNQHIQTDHGPLGAEYPDTRHIMEGDSPSFLYLIPNGAGDPEHPDYGSWGGRYERIVPQARTWAYGAETRPFWTDTRDRVWSTTTGRWHHSHHATIWRWREAYQHDFAARMDWTVKSFDEANHPPVPVVNQPSRLTVKSGGTIALSATGSTDPDNDNLHFEWMSYGEPGTCVQSPTMSSPGEVELSLIAPETTTPCTTHIILAVTDDGVPSLTRYQRIILDVTPE